jgi:hypothetical protein
MHANIRLWKKDSYRNWYTVYAGLTVTQNDPTGPPIAGATIEGTWSGVYDGPISVSGVTNENGGINFIIQWVTRGSTATFTINKVIIGGKEYDFAGPKSASIGI